MYQFSCEYYYEYYSKGGQYFIVVFCVFLDDLHNTKCRMLTNWEPQILTLQLERDRSVIVYLFVPRPIRNVGRRHVLSPDSGCQKGAAQLMALVSAPILDNTSCSSTAWSSFWKPYYWLNGFVFHCILVGVWISLTDSVMTSHNHCLLEMIPTWLVALARVSLKMFRLSRGQAHIIAGSTYNRGKYVMEENKSKITAEHPKCGLPNSSLCCIEKLFVRDLLQRLEYWWIYLEFEKIDLWGSRVGRRSGCKGVEGVWGT